MRSAQAALKVQGYTVSLIVHDAHNACHSRDANAAVTHNTAFTPVFFAPSASPGAEGLTPCTLVE